MSGSALQKYFEDVAGLQRHEFFATTGLQNELSTGEVFPAIRKDEVHFYHRGARLCVYKAKDKNMYSNNRYLGLPDNGRSRDVPIPAVWYTPAKFNELKKTCKGWRHAERELSIVSQLFPEFSISASHQPADRARLLDIECCFLGATGAAAADSKALDMIDCLFLTPQGSLVFVEVKKTSNSEARGNGQSEPAVAGQLRRYRRQLESDKLRKEIKDVYAGVIGTLSQILRRPLPTPKKVFTPRTVFKTVPLLIVGTTQTRSPQSHETWQRDLLAAPLSIESDTVGIDGRDGRMIAKLDAFFRLLDSNLAEAASR